MALSFQQQLANQFSAKVNKPSFFDRFAHDVGNTAKGFFPGILEIGKTVASDLGTLSGGGGPYRSDNLVGSMAKGFMDQSFIPPLLTGQGGEAWDRFNARPFSGLLDATMAAPAYRATTHVGSRIGSESSRLKFAELGGYRQLAPDSAQSLSQSIGGFVGGNTSAFDSMPATLSFTDGAGAAREYLGKPDYMKIGDQHLLRRTERSLLPSGKDVAGTDLASRHRAVMESPEGTLGEDPSRMLTTPRADNELWARAGDVAGSTFNDLFPNFGSKRLARKIQRRLMAQNRVSGDTVLSAAGQADGALIQHLQERYPDMTPEELRAAAGDAVFVDSFGMQPDEILQYNSRWDPEAAPIPDTLPETHLDETPVSHLEKYGTTLMPKNPDGGVADLFRNEDSRLTIREILEKHGSDINDRYVYTRVSPAQKDAFTRYYETRIGLEQAAREALDHQDVSHGFVDWTYRDQNGNPQRLDREAFDADPDSISDLIENRGLQPQRAMGDGTLLDSDWNHLPWVGQEQIRGARAALEGASHRRDVSRVDHPLVQALYNEWDRAKQQYGSEAKFTRARTFIDRVLTRLEKGERPDLRDMASRTHVVDGPGDFSKAPFDYTAARVQRAYEDLSGRDRVTQLLEQSGGDAARIEDLVLGEHKKRYDDLTALYKQMSDARFLFQQLSNRTFGVLGMEDFRRGVNTPIETYRPGIYDRIKETVDPSTEYGQLVRTILQDPKFREEYLPVYDAARNQGADAAREVLGGNRLPEERIQQNQARLRRFLTGQDGEGKFFTMKYPQREMPEGVDYPEHMRMLMSPASQSGPGSPIEVFLSGRFDTGPDVHVRDFLKNNDLRTQQRLVDNIRDSSLVLNDKELAEYESKNVIQNESELGGNRIERPWVKLSRDGALIKEIKLVQRQLDPILHQLRVTGRSDIADNIQEHVDELAAIDPTLDPYSRTVKQSAGDPEVLSVQELEHRLIPTPMYLSLKNEIEQSRRVTSEALKMVGAGWKLTVLHARFPSWFRNNYIGAQIMLAMSGGLTDFAPAYAKTMKSMDGENHQMLTEAFPEASELGSAHIARGINNIKLAEQNPKLGRMFEILNKMSDFNQKWADSPARIARTQQIFDEKVAQLQDMARKNGHELEDTPELRRSMLETPSIRDKIAQEMLSDMVDFSDMSRMEREWISAFFPFWSWMKGSSKSTMRLAADHPERVWGMEQVADVGERESIDDAGAAAPDFARGWVNPFGDTWMSTGGMNPYEAPMDLFTMGLGFVPGGMSYRQFGTENIMGNMHPLISGGAASVLGKDPFFGTPLANDNPMDTFLKMQMNNPIFKQTIGMALQQTGPRSTTNKSLPISLANMGGIPILDPRWGQVWARGVDEAQERYGTSAAIGWLNPPAVGIS